MIDFNNIEQLSTFLREKHKKLVISESLTGGLFSSSITEIAGASDVFFGSFIVYSVESKIGILGCSEELIKKYGVVSKETAIAMSEGALKKSFSIDKQVFCAAGVTGFAGPACTDEQPAGTVCMAVSHIEPHENGDIGYYSIAEQKIFSGRRSEIREQTVNYTVQMLITLLKEAWKAGRVK